MDPERLESNYPPDSRYEEVEKILSFIKSGNSAQVVSLPGVGRSNILRLIAYNRKTRELHLKNEADFYHFVLMNFSEIKRKPTKDATKYMTLEIIESLSLRKMDEEENRVKKLYEEGAKSNDELVLFQALKKTVDYLCLEKGVTLVLLFDRFEDYVSTVEPAFFDNLRALRDRVKFKFSAVFPLNRPLEDALGPEIISSFYEFLVGNIVYLSLSDQKIMEFRRELLEKSAGKKLDPKTQQEVLRLTGGLGKLWLKSTEALLESPDKDVKERLTNSSRVNAVLSEIWNSLTPYEQNLIEAGKAQESSHLVAVGLVKNNKFAVPLLENFAKKQKTSQKINIEDISDKLTSSEYKLLKYMNGNPDKILSRDDVISAVWGELNSTAGVTEQALDQLVFRLRKKIEENPNSPTHIQTVKGRGFKFVE